LHSSAGRGWACRHDGTGVERDACRRLASVVAALIHRDRYFALRFLAQGCSPRPGFTSPWLKRLFFRSVSWGIAAQRVPVVASDCKAGLAVLIALSAVRANSHYVVSVDFIFFA